MVHNVNGNKINSSIPTSTCCTVIPSTPLVAAKVIKLPDISVNTNSDNICKTKYIPEKNKNSILLAITDSGATDNMTSNKNFFEYILPLESGKEVVLGDDKTKLKIEGYGMMNILLNNNRVRIMAYYVPTLGTTLLSIKQHMRYKGNFFHAENNSVVLAYKKQILYPNCKNEFTLKIQPAINTTKSYIFDENVAQTIHATPKGKHNAEEYHILRAGKASKITDVHHQKQLAEKVYVKKLISHAVLPHRVTNGSIGFDLASAQSITIPAHSTQLIGTGFGMDIPDGIYLRLASRSSLAQHNINVGGGVIDTDYIGEIKIIMQNNSDSPLEIKIGQRIAQGIFEQAKTPCLILTDNLNPTQRNNKGFGSSNKNSLNKARQQVVQSNVKKMLLRHQPNKTQRSILDFLCSSTKTTNTKQPTTIINLPEEISTLGDTTTQHCADDEVSIQTEKTTNMSQTSSNCTENTKTNPENQSQSEEDLSENTPPILPNEKCNSSIPQHLSFSKDFVAQAIGYHKLNLLLKYFNRVALPNVSIRSTDKSEVLTDGDTATMKSKKRNLTPSKLPEKYSDVWHMDIVYGPCIAIAGVKYALLLVDKKTRKCFIYALKDLKASIKDALSQFLLDAGTKPKLIRSDFDKKLIGGTTKKFLRDNKI